METTLSTLQLTYDFRVTLTQKEAEQLIESLSHLGSHSNTEHEVAYWLRHNIQAILQSHF